jgi:V8-like Glu-specific endopeptidase
MFDRSDLVCCFLLLSCAGSASAQTAIQGVSASPQQTDTQRPAYEKASPRALPIAEGYNDDQARQALSGSMTPATAQVPRIEQGALGSGKIDQNVLHTAVSKASEDLPNVPQPRDFGTSGLPFSTSRADLTPTPTNDQYPYSSAGKLFFNKAGQTYICSASLIKPGLVVTAAHCVADFGTNSYYSDWEFHPGYRGGASPFGAWTAARAYVLTSYLDGTDSCQQRGVVCKDDIAVLVLLPQNNQYVGKRTGWFAIGWNGLGFTPQRITHVTQLGYPACLDNAGLMERNDSQGGVDSAHADNTIIGSLMCGGSSGGPWIINFGLQPELTGTQFGSSPSPNAIIGVTSWGSTNNAVKWMGASPFLEGNIKRLVDVACNAYPAACNAN